VFLFFPELFGDDVHFLDGLVIGIVPPIVFPVGSASKVLLAESYIVFSSSDLDAIFFSVLVFAESVAFFPAHFDHEFLCVLAFEADVADA
jgi:hypothetical protein